jgi:hypothetical protein
VSVTLSDLAAASDLQADVFADLPDVDLAARGKSENSLALWTSLDGPYAPAAESEIAADICPEPWVVLRKVSGSSEKASVSFPCSISAQPRKQFTQGTSSVNPCSVHSNIDACASSSASLAAQGQAQSRTARCSGQKH